MVHSVGVLQVSVFLLEEKDTMENTSSLRKEPSELSHEREYRAIGLTVVLYSWSETVSVTLVKLAETD